MGLFSQRQGYAQPPKDIAYRGEIPEQLRIPIYDILRRYVPSAFLMERVEAIFNPYGIAPLEKYEHAVPIAKYEDNANTIAFKRFILGCKWYEIYDITEDAFAQLRFHDQELADPDEERRAFPMQHELNEYFAYAGIGWKMEKGKFVARQDEAVENAIGVAITQLETGQRPTAARHLESAVRALSERPRPNTPGAVAHATSAVECVLNDVTGQSASLGTYLKRLPDFVHPALRKALDGIYGYASEAGARHGKEGKEPSFEEAQFAVTSCAAVCTLLNTMNPKEPKVNS